MNTIMRILGAIAVPLAVFNFVGSIVAGIWLAVLGEWGAIGWGIASMFFSAIGVGLAMMPAAIFALPVAYFFERGQRLLAYPFVALGTLYNTLVMTLWCGWVLAFFARRADDSSLIPLLLWSFAMATGPFAFMASKEGKDNIAAPMTAYFAQLGYVVMMVAVFMGIRLLEAMYLFAAVMLLGSVIHFKLALQIEREQKAMATRAA